MKWVLGADMLHRETQDPRDYRKPELALIRTQQKSKFQMKLRSLGVQFNFVVEEF